MQCFVWVLDDLKINIIPLKTAFNDIFTFFNILLPIKIFYIDFPLLSFLLENQFLSSVFVLLCLLFVIIGANLVDGFNGLLTINLLLINIILTYINLNSANLEFSFFLIAQIIILLSFYYLISQMLKFF